MFLNNLPIKVKLFLIGVLGILGAIAVQVFLLNIERTHLVESRQMELQHLGMYAPYS